MNLVKVTKWRSLEKNITSTNDALNIMDLPVDLEEDASRAENKRKQVISNNELIHCYSTQKNKKDIMQET